MFENYTDIIYHTASRTITFPTSGYSIFVYGEGGNRHLKLSNHKGSVDLWIDTHTGYGPDSDPNKSEYAFIGLGGINASGEPGAMFMKYIMSTLLVYSISANGTIRFSKNGLDKMFSEFYQDMKNDRISRW